MIEGAIMTALLLAGIAFDSWKRGTLNVISPVLLMLAWCSILVVGRPAYIELSGTWWFVEYYAHGRPDAMVLIEAFAGAQLGILAWYVAFRSRAYARLMGRDFPDLPVRMSHVIVVALIFLLWGGYAFVRYRPVPIETGLSDLDFYVEDGKFVTTSAYLSSMWLGISCVIFILAAAFRSRLPALILFVIFTGAVFYGGWSRNVAISTAIGLCIIEALKGRRPILLYAFIAIGAVVVPVFNQLSVDREYLQKLLRGEQSHAKAEDWLPMEFSDFDTYVGVVRAVPDSLPYSYGAEMFNRFVVNAVPRTLWKEKHKVFMPDDRRGTRDDLFAGGRVATVFGSLYMEGGLVAIVLVLGISGVLSRYIYQMVLAHRDNAYYMVLYVLLHLDLLSTWRDLYNPQYLFLTGLPLVPLLILSYRRRKAFAGRWGRGLPGSAGSRIAQSG